MAIITGTGGNDSTTGSSDSDTFYGLAGADYVHAYESIDTLYGGEGDDSLIGGIEGDFYYGDGGNDWLHGSADNDSFFGGSGIDTIYYAQYTDGITVDLAAGTITSAGGQGFDRVDADVEAIIGSSVADTAMPTTTRCSATSTRVVPVAPARAICCSVAMATTLSSATRTRSRPAVSTRSTAVPVPTRSTVATPAI
ncbi:MAG: calcium-binding protein [Alphaproteobacteria bacterium]|nr:calcium-binding protein [Alphaproteobacteria bacterium]